MGTAKPPKVLVVEDEPLIRLLASEMLDVLGYGVVEAANGAEALAFSAEELQGLAGALIDLGLPDRPGEEVARELRRRRPGLPLILATGGDAASAVLRLGPEPGLSILEKPYQLKDLELAIAPFGEAC